ncbi:MAG: type 12 methyltransferase [Parcubacteria group bacterium Gr01-1014_70]|nr:MAG: type 12 methyltransferase [Parcubacteria group bacterium Gr01-1014_70]
MKDYRTSHASERIATQYENVVYRAGSYDDMLWKWERGILAREVADLKKIAARVSLLDFATGTGRIVCFLESDVAEAVGVDNAEAMLVRARSHVKKAELVLADLTSQDVLMGKSFDVITAFRFFLNAQPELRDAAFRVLAPKLRDEHSVFIFNVHGNLASHRFFTKLWYALRGKRLNTMTVRQAKHMVEQHGLEVTHWYGFGVKPKFLYRLLGGRFMYTTDLLFSKIPGAKYVSYDLIFVCKRSGAHSG